MEAPEPILALLAAYRATHYDVFLAAAVTATIHIGEPPPRGIADWIGGDGFGAFLTACNPHSQPLPDAQNAARMDVLRRHLRELRARALDGIGHRPGAAWREPSLLVAGLALVEIDALARDLGQNAVVIVPARGAARLRLYRPDWRAALDQAADLEWAPAFVAP